MRVEATQAIVLHAQPYRETSAIVRFFSREHGRLSGVARGVRNTKRKLALQTFDFGLLSAVGRGDLLTVTQFEVSQPLVLSADRLSAGYYVLELVSRSLGEHQSEPAVFDQTLALLRALSNADLQVQAIALALRRYEHALLDLLGFAVEYSVEADGRTQIVADAEYEFEAEIGFKRCAQGRSHNTADVYSGEVLLALAKQDYVHSGVLRAARLIMRAALIPLIGSQPIVSRQLVQATPESKR